MANDSPKKPKVNRTRRRPYEEPATSSSTATGGSKKTGTTKAKSSGASRKKSTAKSTRKPVARSASKPQQKKATSPAAQAPEMDELKQTETPAAEETQKAEQMKTEPPTEGTMHSEAPGDNAEQDSETKVPQVVSEDELRGARAQKVIRKYVVASAGLGLIPVPILDVASLIPVQIALVAELADIYGLQFRDNRDRSILSGILSGLITHALASRKFIYLMRSVPMVGPLLGLVTFPVFSGAATYAAGRVFKHHFEMGGTLLDFDPDKVKGYFSEQFEKGKQVASNMKSGQ